MDPESQVRPAEDRPHPWMKYIPILSLIIGTSAFIFQLTVLYPWHEELSRQFAALAKDVRKLR